MLEVLSLRILFVLAFVCCNPGLFFFPLNGQSQRSFQFPDILAVGSHVTIAAVGDVMLGSWVSPILEIKGAFYPFTQTRKHLRSTDIAIANLEAPFTLVGEPFEKKFNFKVPPKFARGLPDGGIKVVTLANNHIMDYGETGLISTMAALDNIGVKHSGAGMNFIEAHKPAVVAIDGRSVAFFGYSMTFPTEFYAKEDSSGTAYPEPEILTSMLAAWRDSVDFIVTSFHWSAEKREAPKDYQIFFAHLAIDSGSDLVLGHHPHVLQGLEIYKNKLIAYSLGNFAFGSYSQYARDSIILKVHLSQDGLLFGQCVPINVDNSEVEFQPQPVSGERAAAIISKLQKLSLPLNGEKNILSDSGLILGDWANFYDDWLLSTTTMSYLNVALPDSSIGRP